MEYQEEIKNHINECRHRVDVIRNHMNTNGDADTDKCLENIQVLETVIFAMNELQLYKDGKLCLIPESVYYKQCTELDAYKQLGTLEEVGEALEKAEKYHWHNLRKNPEDLPEPEVECEVVVERTYSNYRMNEHARMIELNDGIYWYAEHYGVVHHPKYKMGYGGDHTIEVVAWREIEPFEEG